MLKKLSIIMALALLLGCTSAKERALMQEYENSKLYHKQLQKTEKIQLYDQGSTKVLLTATYINNSRLDLKRKDQKKNKDEVFVVGWYIGEGDFQSLTNEGYSLHLDGKRAKRIKKLEKESPHLKDISFISEWSQFYLIHFPHTSKKSFKLVFESKAYGKGTASFAKVAKYTLTK